MNLLSLFLTECSFPMLLDIAIWYLHVRNAPTSIQTPSLSLKIELVDLARKAPNLCSGHDRPLLLGWEHVHTGCMNQNIILTKFERLYRHPLLWPLHHCLLQCWQSRVSLFLQRSSMRLYRSLQVQLKRLSRSIQHFNHLL